LVAGRAIDRFAGVEAEQRADLPAADDSIDDLRRVAEQGFAATDRKLDNRVGIHGVAGVIADTRNSPFLCFYEIASSDGAAFGCLTWAQYVFRISLPGNCNSTKIADAYPFEILM
jgi:hypothetical protein